MPFYYILPLGGKDSIRGFADFRFRDLNAVLFNAEYRWEALSGLDMALFYDAGTVAPRWSHLARTAVKQSWGIGLRFNTYRVRLHAHGSRHSGAAKARGCTWRSAGPLRLQRYLR